MLFVKDILEEITSHDEKYQLAYLKNRSDQLNTFWTSNGEDPLLVLNPTTFTIPYLCILQSRIAESISNKKVTETLLWVEKFAQSFQKPISSLVTEEVVKLCQTLSSIIGFNDQYIANYLVIIASKFEIIGETHELSPIHSMCIMYCLETESYDCAVNILENPISDVDGSVNVKDFLFYHYYGAIIMLALGKLKPAFQLLAYVLYTPGSAASAIQIEAYKKIILLGLLLKGKSPCLPHQMPVNIQNTLMDHSSRAYISISDAFESCDFSKMEGLLSKNFQIYDDDGNYGLVKQCANQLISRKIQLLTKTYLTLSLNYIEKLIGVPGMKLISPFTIEEKICQMIKNGEIAAKISQIDEGIVTFLDISSNDYAPLLCHRVEKLVSSSGFTKELNRTIGESSIYISSIGKSLFFE